jgi:cytoplasmic iron level regulating protein YaaA (DUF328/UPF0246 family)
MSYLITCSKAKVIPNRINPSSLQNLSYPQLNEIRQTLINQYQMQKNTVLNWDRCLPAWQLYSGPGARLYPRVTNVNWTKPNTDVTILSALFGLIKHTDLIPYYDLQMKSKIGKNNKCVYRIWNEFQVLHNYISNDDIDLLSDDYRKAINNKAQLNAIQPNVIFSDRGVQKGRWLNEKLQLL